jgi:hypothetical protein
MRRKRRDIKIKDRREREKYRAEGEEKMQDKIMLYCFVQNS